MLDSTPDIAQQQVSEIVRYVRTDEDRNVEIKKVFLGIFQTNKKDAGNLANKILEKFEEDKVYIGDSRGQTYDNAAVMAVVRGSVQQKILGSQPQNCHC